jgi:hypothetical protein
VTCTPSFFAFSTISARFLAPTAEAIGSISKKILALVGGGTVTDFSDVRTIVHEQHVNISGVVNKEHFMS